MGSAEPPWRPRRSRRLIGVGQLIFFSDPAGNPIAAIQYDPSTG